MFMACGNPSDSDTEKETPLTAIKDMPPLVIKGGSVYDEHLWGGQGKTAYVTGNGSYVVSRMILPYEED